MVRPPVDLGQAADRVCEGPAIRLPSADRHRAQQRRLGGPIASPGLPDCHVIVMALVDCRHTASPAWRPTLVAEEVADAGAHHF